jgi:hypothetical protein
MPIARIERIMKAAMAMRLRVERFMGLSGDVAETSGSGSENEVENPKAFVFVAFDALIITKDCDSIGETVPINVHETGAEKFDCSVNVGE